MIDLLYADFILKQVYKVKARRPLPHNATSWQAGANLRLWGGKTTVKPNGLHPGWVGSEKPPERSEGP